MTRLQLGLDALEQRLGRDYRSALAEDRILVTNLRHREALQRTREALQRALDGLDAGLSGDLLAVDHRDALDQLGAEVYGNVESGALFSSRDFAASLLQRQAA